MDTIVPKDQFTVEGPEPPRRRPFPWLLWLFTIIGFVVVGMVCYSIGRDSMEKQVVQLNAQVTVLNAKYATLDTQYHTLQSREQLCQSLARKTPVKNKLAAKSTTRRHK